MKRSTRIILQCSVSTMLMACGGEALEPAGGEETTFPVGRSSSELVKATGTITHRNSGWCLDVANGKADDGTPIGIYPCHGGANQSFQIDPFSGTIYSLAGKGLVLRGSSSANGTQVELRQYPSSTAAFWTFTSNGEIRSKLATSKCLAVRADNAVILTTTTASKIAKEENLLPSGSRGL